MGLRCAHGGGAGGSPDPASVTLLPYNRGGLGPGMCAVAFSIQLLAEKFCPGLPMIFLGAFPNNFLSVLLQLKRIKRWGEV